MSVWDKPVTQSRCDARRGNGRFATTTWIDRPTPVIEQAFVESFARYLEQRHLDAME